MVRSNAKEPIMRDAQIGLLVATLLVLAFAARLYHVSALGLSGLLMVGMASIAITLVLLFS